MSDMISVKIDVTKLKKEAFFKGDKGTYATLTLIPNKNGEDQYGNTHFVVQDLGKEARQRNERGPILGNAKLIDVKRSARNTDSQRSTTEPPIKPPEYKEDDVPF